MTTPKTIAPTMLVKSLLAARRPEDVDQLLALAKRAGIDGSRAIGDREMNAATIEIASSPYRALPERVTNAIDGVIDLFAIRAGYKVAEDWPERPQGPREAARILLGLPKAGLGDLVESERRELAKMVVVMLDDSGIKEKPTVSVADRGTGEHPSEMPTGMLSLNRDNKVRKPWQHGAYGQGGSATLRFAPYTVFMTRKAPDLLEDGQGNLVGWTVAFKDEGDPYKEDLPVYRYLVDQDGNVPTFDPALLPDPDWYGTRIVHVAYDLTRYWGAYTQLQNGAWGMFQSALFDPVLPVLLGGRRQIDLDAVKKGAVADDDMSDLAVTSTDSTRVVLGNKVRLDLGPPGNDPEIAWRWSETIDLSKAHGRDLGRLRVNYWVVRRPVDSQRKTDPTLAYVTADSAVTVTLSGQRHESERRAWLKEKLGLPYLAKSLIVQVDIDELSPPARRELFSATREQMVDGPMKGLIYEETVGILKRDTELRRLEHEQRERAMSKGAEDVAQGVRDKLRKWVDTFLKGQTRTVLVDDDDETEGPRRRKKDKQSPPRSTDDSNLPNVPTDMKFERDPIVIRQGKRTTVWVHVDAKNGYLTRHEDDLSVTLSDELGGKVLHVGMSELLAGKSLWTFKADDDAPIGDGEIEAVLITSNGLITSSARVSVVAAPKDTGAANKKKKQVPEKGPNIVWVTRDEWDADFNEKTVGQVNIGTAATDIRINRHHPVLEKALGAKSLGEEATKTRANKYLFAMACGLFRQEWMMRNGSQLTEEQVRAEQERMAEAVLIAIDDKSLDLDD